MYPIGKGRKGKRICECRERALIYWEGKREGKGREKKGKEGKVVDETVVVLSGYFFGNFRDKASNTTLCFIKKTLRFFVVPQPNVAQ